MNIVLKKSSTKWIDIGFNPELNKTIKFKIDYPTIEQKEILDELNYDAYGKTLNLKASIKPEDIDIDLDLAKWLKYKRRVLKYCIKDWEGLETKCETTTSDIKGTELSAECWELLCQQDVIVNHIFNCISKETALTIEDKKK